MLLPSLSRESLYNMKQRHIRNKEKLKKHPKGGIRQKWRHEYTHQTRFFPNIFSTLYSGSLFPIEVRKKRKRFVNSIISTNILHILPQNKISKFYLEWRMAKNNFPTQQTFDHCSNIAHNQNITPPWDQKRLLKINPSSKLFTHPWSQNFYTFQLSLFPIPNSCTTFSSPLLNSPGTLFVL